MNWSRGGFPDQCGNSRDSGSNLEIAITYFANGVDLGAERQAGVKDADLGNCWAIPCDGATQGGGEGEVRGGVRDGWKWSS